MKNSASSVMFACVMRRRSPSSALDARSSSSTASALALGPRVRRGCSRVLGPVLRSPQLMAKVLRPIGHEDRLSLVDHLDELRGRLIVCAAVLGAAFAVCLWQNHTLLEIINEPLKTQTRKQVAKGEGTVGQAVLAQQGLLKVASDTEAALALLAKPGSGVRAPSREQLTALVSSLRKDVAKIPRTSPGDNPVTLGV